MQNIALSAPWDISYLFVKEGATAMFGSLAMNKTLNIEVYNELSLPVEVRIVDLEDSFGNLVHLNTFNSANISTLENYVNNIFDQALIEFDFVIGPRCQVNYDIGPGSQSGNGLFDDTTSSNLDEYNAVVSGCPPTVANRVLLLIDNISPG